jgi:hypothetical protein
LKHTRILIPVLVATVIVLGLAGCGQIFKPDTKAVADNALVILKSMRGSASNCYEPGGSDGRFGFAGKDSAYVDETERGVRTVGWVFYDDGGTPLDSTDDVIAIRGQRIYLDWGNITHNIWLSVRVWPGDRATEQAVRNTATRESSYVSLGKVNRPGGIQSGPAFWTDGEQSVEMVMGIHHNETPDDWSDNYTFTEFYLVDGRETDTRFLVHSDFRPDHSGSGDIRKDNAAGELVATFQWDNFGRGSLVVNGQIYPFEW